LTDGFLALRLALTGLTQLAQRSPTALLSNHHLIVQKYYLQGTPRKALAQISNIIDGVIFLQNLMRQLRVLGIKNKKKR
jgi:hypothetical protein